MSSILVNEALKLLWQKAFEILHEHEASYVPRNFVTQDGTVIPVGEYSKTFYSLIEAVTDNPAEQFILGQLCQWSNDCVNIGEEQFGLKLKETV